MISLSFCLSQSHLLPDMAEQKQVAIMDNITAVQPAMVDAGTLEEFLPNEPTIEPLDQLEDPKVRIKLRIYAILVALYVHYPFLVPSAQQLANDAPSRPCSS
jgi:hypothetical protein